MATYLLAQAQVPAKHQLRDAFREKFGVDLVSKVYSDAINAELDRRKLQRRHKGWRITEGDRSIDQPSWADLEAQAAAWARAEATVPTIARVQKYFASLSGGKALLFDAAARIVREEIVRRGGSKHLPAPKPAAPIPLPRTPKISAPSDAQSEINAAIELLLAAVPNLAKLTLTVDDAGAASVEFTTRVVQTVQGKFALARK